MTITNDRPDFTLLIKDLAAFSIKQPQVIFQATGVYSRRLQAFLKGYGYSYIIINPLKSKKRNGSRSAP